jgi:hypothetical protein
VIFALSPEQRKTMLGNFSRFLKPQGRILLDVYSLASYDERQEESCHEKNLLDGFWSGDQYDGFLNVFKYIEEKVILDKYTIVQKDKTRVIYNWLQYFSSQSLEKELDQNGFNLEEIFADVSGAALKPDGKEFAVVIKINKD